MNNSPAGVNSEPSMPQKGRVIAMAASAGGLKALDMVLSGLPSGFPAAITIVQHLIPNYPSLLVPILARRTHLTVRQANEGDDLEPGCVFIAPPDRHLLVTDDQHLTLSKAALVHFVRPSADLLFESVAASCGELAICVVLSGTGYDGSQGVRAIKKMGGIVIAQDEASSEFFGMPAAAIATGCVDRILPLPDIAGLLIHLVLGEFGNES